MSSIINDSEKKRKQRKIYNAYTDIDSVNEAPGPGFRNWIITTKKKLEEREINLLSVRMDVIKAAIYQTVHDFNNNSINQEFGVNINMKCVEDIYKTINYDLISISINCLKIVLSDWNGIDLTRSTKKFNSFRKYFVVSKNWFDQRKKSVLAQHFWSTILDAVKQFAINAAKQCFCNQNISIQYEYSQYLLLKLIFGIFASKTQFSSTKPQPVIPGGTIKDTNDIKKFLENSVDETLSMIKLVQQNGQNSEQETSATQTLQFILNQLEILINCAENTFHSSLYSINCNVNPLLLDDKKSSDSNDTNTSNTSSPNIIQKVETINTFPSMLTVNNNDNNNNNNNIINNHQCPFNQSNSNDSNNSNNNEYIIDNKNVINDMSFQRISNPFLPNINDYNTNNNNNITSTTTTMYNNNNNNITSINNNNFNNNFNNNNMLNAYNYNHCDNAFNFVDYPNVPNYDGNIGGNYGNCSNFSSFANNSNYSHYSNNCGYGPVHHSSSCVSENRHSPVQFNQFNKINQCHQCNNCNQCNVNIFT